VSAEYDFDDKDFDWENALPPDQPTAIARPQTYLHIPVAEPTETSALMGIHYPDRDFLWD
jgi:hypothetical protein